MSGKIKILGLVLTALGALIAGVVLVSRADVPRSTDILLKAKFTSGFLDVMEPIGTPDVTDAQGIFIPNRILNDVDGSYYKNGSGSGNFIVLRNAPMPSAFGGGFFVLDIVTDRRSPRYVNLYFDAEVSPPGTNLKSYCGMDYFLDNDIVPITTTRLLMVSGGEWAFREDPADLGGIPILEPRGEANFNFVTMTDGQVAYVYLFRYYFWVPDYKPTKYNETQDHYAFADCCWMRVEASDWDGEKVNAWTLTPVTEPFKHQDWKDSTKWCVHPEGAIPYKLFSNAVLSCDHGTYRMPWQLEITRRP